MFINNKQLLIDFSKAIAVPLYNTDAIKWPIRSSHVISVVNDIYAVEYLNQLQELACNYNPQAWKQAIPSSLILWRMAHHIINGLEKANLSKQEIAEDCLLMIDIIRNIDNSDELFSCSHLITSTSEIEYLSCKYDRICENAYMIQLISLATLLWAYSESLYFQGREICCEYHGPYHYNEEIVIIRDFANFMPVDLWENGNYDTKIKSVRIVSFHKENVDLTIDAFNNVNISGGNFVDFCTGGLLFVNNRIVSKKEINAVIEEFSQKLEYQLELVNAMNKEELYQKYAYIFWYRKKSLADYLGHEWTPPPKVFDVLSVAKIEPSAKSNYRTAEGIHYLERRYDYSQFI